MKYLKQFFIIVFISFIGEMLNKLIPLPIPASIYGMVILFVCLCTNIIKYDDVKDVGKLLIDIMPVMFVPAGVGLITAWDVLKDELIPIILITVVSIVTVMGVCGRVTQYFIKLQNKHTTSGDDNND